MFRKGDLVKLISYDTVASRKDQIAVMDHCVEGANECSIVWLKDNAMAFTTQSNVVKVKTYKINGVMNKIKVGDLIITNGDGTRVMDKFIYGEVGELLTNNDKRCMILWNNTIAGSNGNVTRPSKWSKSWLIYLNNRRADMVFVKEKMKSIEKSNGSECSECGKKFTAASMKEFEDKKYCTECFEHLFEECSECGDITEKDGEREFNGDKYCQNCYDENIVHCEGCGELGHKDDLTYSERADNYYCDDCYSERFCSCHSCDHEMYTDDDDRMTGSDDNTYCRECWDERFGLCESCNEVHRRDDMEYNEDEECYYCADCYNSDGGEEAITPIRARPTERVIHEYGYKPDPKFKKMGWDNNLYMGLELEVQHKDKENDSAKKLIEYMKEEKVDEMFYLKHDGSVNSGFEIVSHPFTIAYAHKELKLKKILDWMKTNQYTSEESGDCGLHIHLSRDFFEDLDLTKIRLFFIANKEKLRILSGRKGKGENFCEFEKLSVKEIVNDVSQSGRYWAVNMNSSTNTIELRMFRGTLDSKRLAALLQFADAISNFVKEVGVTSMIFGERQYKKNSWGLFTDWCKDTRKYGTMLNYMKGEKLCV